jgi:hypothetical protein
VGPARLLEPVEFVDHSDRKQQENLLVGREAHDRLEVGVREGLGLLR